MNGEIMNENTNGKFWTVFSPQGGPSTKKHDSPESARGECIRLLQQQPLKTFFVMEAVEQYNCAPSPIVVTSLHR